MPANITTSRLKGGYLPSPGVAFAEAETMSTRTRWTYPKVKAILAQKRNKTKLRSGCMIFRVGKRY